MQPLQYLLGQPIPLRSRRGLRLSLVAVKRSASLRQSLPLLVDTLPNSLYLRHHGPLKFPLLGLQCGVCVPKIARQGATTSISYASPVTADTRTVGGYSLVPI